MIFSVFDYDSRKFLYYQAPGTCPPHGWFRPPTPGQLRQPEEMAAQLPEGAVLVGSGPTARGIIATDIPGVGTIDHSTPPSGRETGLGVYGPGGPLQNCVVGKPLCRCTYPTAHHPWNCPLALRAVGGPHPGFVPPRERPHQAAYQRAFQRDTPQEWDSTSRGWDVR